MSTPGKSVSDSSSASDIIKFVKETAAKIPKVFTKPGAKSVTKDDKADIIAFANTLIKAAQLLQSKLPDFNATIPVGSDSGEVRDIIREELALFRADFEKLQPKSYAAAAAPGPQPKQVKTPKSRPAIVISSNKPDNKSHDEVIGEFKKSVTFKDTDFAPSKWQRVSNGKVRIEFDDVKQRDSVLRKLDSATSIKAESAKRSRPLVIIKGISGDIKSEEVSDIIRAQNTSLNATESDIKLRFVRKNRNDKLFNAVMEVSPAVRLGLLRQQRVNVDHQRVRVEDFSPFIQCFKCLGFGHTQSKCTAEFAACSHCASKEHTFRDCPSKSDAGLLKCFNCSSSKYRSKSDCKHSATSAKHCTKIKAMVQRINERTDFGC